MYRAVNKDHNLYHLLRLSMFCGYLMVQVKWSIVDTIHIKGNEFVVGVKIKATDE